MGKRFDLTGRKFTRWAVIQKEPSVVLYGKTIARWLCICDCGEKRIINAGPLLAGQSKSCGCLRNELSKIRCSNRIGPIQKVAHRTIFANYKQNAKVKKVPFALSSKSFSELIISSCHYCNSKPSNLFVRRKTTSSTDKDIFRYSGVDRVEPSLGYVDGNCVPCCSICNMAKLDRSLKEFISWIDNLVAYRISLAQEVSCV